MTSNQISAALARENERHNLEAEKLERTRQQETKRANKTSELLQAAQNINQAANTINQVYGNTTAYVNKQNEQNIELLKYKQNKKVTDEQLRIQGLSQAEIERHNKLTEELQLRDIKHLEYQDQLTQIRDAWNRDQDLFQNNATIAANTLKEAQNATQAYLAQLQRAQLINDTTRMYYDNMMKMYDMQLTQAQTDEARARIITNYLNATSNMMKSISGLIPNIP